MDLEQVPIGRHMTLDNDATDLAAKTERQVFGKRHRLDSGQRRDAAEHLALERGSAGAIVTLQFEIERHRHHMARIESRIEGIGVPQPAHEQPGTREQQRRQRDLRDHESIAQPRATHAGRLVAQRRHHIGTHRFQRRNQPEHDAGQHRDHEREHQHTAIGSEVESEVERQRRLKREQQIRAPQREQHAEPATRECQQHALGDELRDEPPAARPERKADADFAAPCSRAGEHQARDVGARDQQHERDHDQQQRHEAHHRPTHRGVHARLAFGDHRDETATVGRGVLDPQLAHHDVHFRFGALGRHALGESPDDEIRTVAALGEHVAARIGERRHRSRHPQVRGDAHDHAPE